MSWHILVVNSNAERRVSDALIDKGLIVYYPKLKYPVIHRHTVEVRERAAFSRYIFLSLPCVIVKLRNTPGLQYVMKNSEGEYSIVDDEIVHEIQDREKHGFFNEGSICAIHDLHARVLDVAKRGKVKVSIFMFGVERVAEMSV